MGRVGIVCCAAFIVLLFVLSGTGVCFGGEKDDESEAKGESKGILEISFDFTRQRTIASNQYAVWIEDAEGNMVKTLYVTAFTGRGGYLRRPDCLPTWVKKANPASLAPEEIDAISSATPKSGQQTYTWDGKDEEGNYVSLGEYRFFIEATLYWSNRVVFTGTFVYGGESIEDIPVTVERFGGKENEGMITNVKAEYKAL